MEILTSIGINPDFTDLTLAKPGKAAFCGYSYASWPINASTIASRRYEEATQREYRQRYSFVRETC